MEILLFVSYVALPRHHRLGLMVTDSLAPWAPDHEVLGRAMCVLHGSEETCCGNPPAYVFSRTSIRSRISMHESINCSESRTTKGLEKHTALCCDGWLAGGLLFHIPRGTCSPTASVELNTL